MVGVVLYDGVVVDVFGERRGGVREPWDDSSPLEGLDPSCGNIC